MVLATAAPATTITLMNEIHDDNDGTDSGEAIEIAGLAGTDLGGIEIVLYNGSVGTVYDTVALSGVIPDQENGFGTLAFSFPTNGIQNGSPDGFGLAYVLGGSVLEFLSYEGTFTALDGPAAGMTSLDIGVRESSSTPVGFSLQLVGGGSTRAAFLWSDAIPETFGAVNTGQSFLARTTRAIPEPSTFGLLALGLLAIGSRAVRRGR